MKRIVLFLLLGAMAVGCKSNKRVVAPPFEEEETVVAAPAVKPTAKAKEQTAQTGQPIVTKEEKVMLTHGEEMKKYNVIVGSFGDVNNAIRLRNRLVGEGYKSIIMKNENNMHRVSIASFDTETPARTELSRVRTEMPEFSDAWLLIVKEL